MSSLSSNVYSREKIRTSVHSVELWLLKRAKSRGQARRSRLFSNICVSHWMRDRPLQACNIDECNDICITAQAGSVKVAGYWPSYFNAFLWTDTSLRSLKTKQKKRLISSHLYRTSLVKRGQ